ncbi:MAG: TlpA family protein disulfide reductase, partial [Nitrospirae bacterium]
MILSLVTLLFTLSCKKGSEKAFVNAEIGKPAPNFALKNLEGRQVSLSDFKGKVVVIEFWATWCHACKETAPVLVSLYEKYKEQGLVVIGITLDTGYGAEENVRKFVEIHNQKYPILWDDKITSKAYGAIKIPVTYVLDRDHIIRQEIIGYIKGYGEKLEEAVRKYL